MFPFLSFGQAGGDVIIWLDNSGSIDDADWNSMVNSVNKIINGVLTCNGNNRIAVVHYAGNVLENDVVSPTLYIESDFTSSPLVALNFTRRGGVTGTHYPQMGNDDFAHESLALIGNALDNSSSPGIIGSQSTLNHDPNRSLVIFFFTDAYRSSALSLGVSSSSIVSATNMQVGSSLAFDNYTQFKVNRNASFIITLVPNDSEAVPACAAIASAGGSYNGVIESFSADPDGAGSLPRQLTVSNFFDLSTQVVSNLVSSICSEIPGSFVGTQTIVIPNVLVLSSQDGNNTFFVKSLGVRNFNCQILNRWGNVLYEYVDPNGSWNGITNEGLTAEEGVYFYKIEVDWEGGKSETFHGFITLVK